MKKSSNSNGPLSLKRLLAFIALPLLLLTMVVTLKTEGAFAASGGRIGGGSFRTPSIPRGGSYRGYGGYGGSYRRGGIGFPFILPIFGFGGGSLFGFLILMSIAGVIVNSIRGGNSPQTERSLTTTSPSNSSVTMIQLQLGLLASAKALQKDLRGIAKSASTDTATGLQKVLQETTLALLRQPNLWVYANLETGQVPFSAAESTFNRLSITERSKLSSEITSNFSGQIISDQISGISAGMPGETNEYIAVTILLAAKKKLTTNDAVTTEQLQECLRTIGSVSSTDLLALEVIWQPEGLGDVLSSEELVTTYPNLKHL